MGNPQGGWLEPRHRRLELQAGETAQCIKHLLHKHRDLTSPQAHEPPNVTSSEETLLQTRWRLSSDTHSYAVAHAYAHMHKYMHVYCIETEEKVRVQRQKES